ncbi:MAG: response regulator [Planctomycetota bacterium]|jgi:CheY-like chemotaxis protein/anti-sigma regulatory factor (Ser/Thr protein kinase)
MARILVVDDSKVDQHLVGSLLEQMKDVTIVFAGDGREALAQMAKDLPDLVLTDLQMPGMNGLELVGAIRHSYAGVPVVLMTAHGSEEVAAAALRRGAASYVPKRDLANDLAETVDRVLAVTRAQREHTVFGCLAETNSHFVLDNDPSLIKPLIAYLREEIASREFCDETVQMQVAVALDEVLINAMHHGNLEVDSALRELGWEVYCAEVQERRRTAPYCARRVHVTAKVTADEAVYVVRDDGNGFDPSTLPDPLDPSNLEKASGRGLLLVRTFMDEVQHNERGNQVKMVKRREA